MKGEKQRVFLATGNAHKVEEFQKLAAASGLAVDFVRPPTMPPVLEDTGTFVGNARKKAAALKAILPSGAWVLADDSGLCVDALDGAPGVESAYFAGPQGDAAANLRKLTEVMRQVPPDKRSACFVCVLVLLPGGKGDERVFEGRCMGSLLREPAGQFGFGYDPLFAPEGQSHSYAEIDAETKNKISHRARAFAQFARWLENR